MNKDAEDWIAFAKQDLEVAQYLYDKFYPKLSKLSVTIASSRQRK